MPPSRVERLTSLHNPLLKRIRLAIQKGALTEDGLWVAEGFHLLEEAINSGLPPEIIVGTAQGLSSLGNLADRIIEVPDALFRDISGVENPQGILALVRPPVWERSLLQTPQALLLALDGIQDPGNAGTILRSAEAFGVTAVIALRGTVDMANPKVLRASAGSVFRLPVFRAELAELPSPLYGASGSGELTVDAVDWRGAATIIIGSEGRGLTEAVRKACRTVAIPTTGVESLNAATAATIFLYEAARQRRQS